MAPRKDLLLVGCFLQFHRHQETSDIDPREKKLNSIVAAKTSTPNKLTVQSYADII